MSINEFRCAEAHIAASLHAQNARGGRQKELGCDGGRVVAPGASAERSEWRIAVVTIGRLGATATDDRQAWPTWQSAAFSVRRSSPDVRCASSSGQQSCAVAADDWGAALIGQSAAAHALAVPPTARETTRRKDSKTLSMATRWCSGADRSSTPIREIEQARAHAIGFRALTSFGQENLI